VEESPRVTGDTSPGLTLAGVAAASLLREELGVEHRAIVEPPPATPAPGPSPIAAAASTGEWAPTPAPGWMPLPARTPPPGGSATPGSPAVPLKRSDPAEARARRQRLLAKAMQNMGVNPTTRPLSGPNATPLPGTVRAVPAASAVDPADEALRKALLQIAPRAKERSYFARLGLPETAGRDEVKSAFLSLARQFHPDLFGSAAMADLQDQVRDFFSAVNEAYQGLSDDKRRAQHLEALRSGGATDPRRADSARLDYQKGEVCLRTRDHVRARGFLESAVRADPRPEYQAALAQSYLDVTAGKDLARAKELITAALASPGLDGPGKDRVHYVAGLLAQAGGSQAEAERQFKAAVAANPNHTEAVRELRAMEGWRTRSRR
jgi:tetratricopeptide (TPR) repeat protein